MFRSLVLTFSLVLLSATLPCLCAESGGLSDFPGNMSAPCVSSEMAGADMSASHGSDSEDHGMNPLDHIASWRAFFSSSFETLFVLVVFACTLVPIFLFPQAVSFSLAACLAASRPPPLVADGVCRNPLFRALFSGVLHGKAFGV